MSGIKAIETAHNGYWFRSRLEARWAVFFDTFGVSYFYEREGYESKTPRFRYLPDFFIPSWNAFIEIKGDIVSSATEENLSKWIYLSETLNRNFIILFQDAWPFHYTFFIPAKVDDYKELLETARLFFGPAQFCIDDKGVKYLMMFISGYVPGLLELAKDYIHRLFESGGASAVEDFLLKSDDEIGRILNTEHKELARLCFFPLDKEPHFPVAIYKVLDRGEFVLDEDKELIIGIWYRTSPDKRVCLGESGNLVLKSANGINAMNLNFWPATKAYTAARQARFEYGQ